MKTIFITGTSSGLGKAAVELFHSRGWTVIATMRNIDKAKQFAHLERVTVLPLDINDTRQIRAAAAAPWKRLQMNSWWNRSIPIYSAPSG